ncbi:MAG: ribosome recycling factor [Dehalococcoidia bacterium]|nr:ribosome recycling factor [Dehalococcoidia bacterium]
MASGKGQELPSLEEVLKDASSRMTKAVDALQRDLASLRTGRATPALLENVSVDYYGVPTPLGQLATISVPEARLITIQPWDRQSLREIEKSLLKSDLGFNPSNDGTIIRVPVPPLSQERRRDLVRVLKKKVEDGKVAVRNVRRDAMERQRSMERNKVISQDETRRAQDQLQKATDAHVRQMDRVLETKEAEIMEV